MAGWARDIAQEVRRVARQESERRSTPSHRFRVTRTSPLRLESLHTDLVLSEGDPDFSIGAGVVEPSEGDIVLVHADTNGDYVATDVIGPDAARTSGGVIGYSVPKGHRHVIPEGQYGFVLHGSMEIDGALEVNGKLVEPDFTY